ncbi:MAG: pentapeptide repeat-containing protein [Firmicutes bacterium]|nr:pentapeptide repeat-containing protein [Bacillota bacterium]
MNPEHLALLKQSIQEFNKWRADNWNIKPDLSGADLRGMNLFQANLTDTNLSSADLSDAILVSAEARSADFDHTNLAGAQCQGVNFSLSNMTRASFHGANLTGTSLQNCCLVEVDFTEADCTGALFNNSNLQNSTFYDAKVKGANFDGTNVHEANIYAEQFRDANIPLELIGSVENKKKPYQQFIYAFVSFAVVFILGFFAYNWIFTANQPGQLNTQMRSRIHYQVALCMVNMKMPENAIKNINITLMLDDNNAEAHSLAAECYRDIGDIPNAVLHYQRFIDLLGADNLRTQKAKEFIYKHSNEAKKQKKSEGQQEAKK